MIPSNFKSPIIQCWSLEDLKLGNGIEKEGKKWKCPTQHWMGHLGVRCVWIWRAKKGSIHHTIDRSIFCWFVRMVWSGQWKVRVFCFLLCSHGLELCMASLNGLLVVVLVNHVHVSFYLYQPKKKKRAGLILLLLLLDAVNGSDLGGPWCARTWIRVVHLIGFSP